MNTRILKALACFLVAIAMAPLHAATPAQRTFDTAEEAAKALVDAVRAEDASRILAVVGPNARVWLMSADEVADRAEWRAFIAAHDKKNAMARHGDNKALLTVGEEAWEFPAPIVRKAGKWSFDSAAGREEILNRRVGRNELDTIQTLLAIVDAQREFASEDADGNGVRDYAARFASTPGKKDGLYWEVGAGEQASPLGALVAKAAAEGYGEKLKQGKIQPYQGYVFRMLMSQGAQATGGAYDYKVDGRMFGGFAVIAIPAAYGNTGVKTFIVNHEGVVYEKDLGTATKEQAAKIVRYNPDKTWTKAQ